MRGSAACLVLATFFVLAAGKDAHGKVHQQKKMTLGKAQQKKMTPYVEETETNHFLERAVARGFRAYVCVRETV